MIPELTPARHKAVVWWAERGSIAARCDLCCRLLEMGEGYLFSSEEVRRLWPEMQSPAREGSDWLVCEACVKGVNK